MPTETTEARIPAEISPKSALRRSDRDIWVHARGQHGVLTLAQLQALGLSDRAVRDRVAAGRLHRVHRGVFAAESPTRAGRWMAAVLAAGGRAVLSHRSAGVLWGVATEGSKPIAVTVLGRTRRALPGISIHSGTSLTAADVTVRDGIPCTSLARTLLDFAATVDARELERALGRAEELRLFDLGAIRELLDRSRGRRGARALSTAIARYAEPPATRSAPEARLLTLVRRHGLPEPEVNPWLPLPEGGGYRPDFLWRPQRLIVEVDGRAYHARRAAFEHDRRRDRRLARAGFETRRYAAREIRDEPDAVVAELLGFLSASN